MEWATLIMAMQITAMVMAILIMDMVIQVLAGTFHIMDLDIQITAMDILIMDTAIITITTTITHTIRAEEVHHIQIRQAVTETIPTEFPVIILKIKQLLTGEILLTLHLERVQLSQETRIILSAIRTEAQAQTVPAGKATLLQGHTHRLQEATAILQDLIALALPVCLITTAEDHPEAVAEDHQVAAEEDNLYIYLNKKLNLT